MLKKFNSYFTLTLIFTLANMVGIFWIFGARVYGDTERYLNIINWIWGWQVDEKAIGFLRPLGPILAAPFEFLGDGAGLVVQNCVFYIASAVLVFKIVELLSGDKRQAFIGAVFFVTATPVLEVGLAYLTDSGAWFFYLLSVFLTLRFFAGGNYRLIPLNGFLSGLAFLLKENGALGSLFFGMMVLLHHKFSLKQKVLHVLKFGIFFAIPILAIQFPGYFYLHYTHIDWLKMNISSGDPEGLLVITMRYVGQLFRVLGLLWPLVLMGIWAEINAKNKNRLLVYASLLPSSFAFLLWSTSAGGRSVFIVALLGISLATFGWMAIERQVASRVRNAFLAGLIVIITIANYWFVYVNQEINFTDMVIELLK